ncbi:MAG TPA: hypothetical protein VKT49_19800 [Bryobacteraceae bacterium]|nr:hypothetical protein [Bryobacteraceae bacterium]
MASKTQDIIYESFKALSSGGPVAKALEHTAAQLGALTAATSSNSKSTGNSALTAVSKVFTSGLGLVPLVSGLLGLFGGGGPEQPPALVKYSMPEKLYFQGADSGANIYSGDYDQYGLPRVYRPAPGSTTPGETAPVTGPIRGAVSGGAPQIIVNVQAMDSRSFLDHSTEIAQAVRQAMLNLNSINDVVSDL